jgi:hypothetical protein
MAFGAEEDGACALDGVVEREAVAVFVEAGHELEGGEGAGDVEYYPEAEEVAGLFEAYEGEEGFHGQAD